MKRCVDDEFVQGQYVNNLVVATTPDELLSGFARHHKNPPTKIEKRTDG